MKSGLSRRTFLTGLAGASVGLPWLESLHGRAHAQSAPPKRVVFVFHPQGTMASRFKPSSVGALPSTLPDLLQPLAAHRARLTVVSGVSNRVSWLNTASNAHNTAARSLFTCQPFVGVKQGQNPSNGPADGPSIDWVLGPKLQGGAPRSVVNLGVRDGDLGEYTAFWQASGRAASLASNPTAVASSLFSSIASNNTAVVAPSRADLLRGRRKAVSESVMASFKRLSARVPSEDRARLDAHAAQLEALAGLSSAAPSGQATESCDAPSLSMLPSGYDPRSSNADDKSAAAQIENTAMLLACDITRVVTLQFTEYHDPRFPFLFGGDTNAAVRGAQSYSDWHAMVYTARSASDTQGVSNLATGFRWYMSQVAALADRLATIQDAQGTTLLDNTLIVAISEFGDGGSHDTSNLPVTLVGRLGGALRGGQHVDGSAYTTGDLYTTLQSLLTGETTPFGMTGNTRDGQPYHHGLLNLG